MCEISGMGFSLQMGSVSYDMLAEHLQAGFVARHHP
jgi:hypothetical protein